MPQVPQFYVVRVNKRPLDTYAADTLNEAIELAAADDNDTVEFGVVSALDAGAARLESPRQWVDASLPAYAWPGGYPIAYYCADGGTLCPKCAAAECKDKPAEDKQWAIVAAEVHWEGDPLQCDNCNAEIESAYGPVEE